MANKDWKKVLETEDRIIENSDRKHRHHFNSLESMSEELIYRESMVVFREQDPMEFYKSGDFIEKVRDEKLANALRSLTEKQRQVIRLIFWEGYKQENIAEMLDCSQVNISQQLSKALHKLAKELNSR